MGNSGGRGSGFGAPGGMLGLIPRDPAWGSVPTEDVRSHLAPRRCSPRAPRPFGPQTRGSDGAGGQVDTPRPTRALPPFSDFKANTGNLEIAKMYNSGEKD